MRRKLGTGFLTGKGGPVSVPFRATIDGIDYEGRLKRNRIHKSQLHLIARGQPFWWSRTGTVHLIRLRPFTRKDLERAKRYGRKLAALFESP